MKQEAANLRTNSQLDSSHCTKMCFFSQAGKKRLTRIWEENRLSEELIFSGLIGPTDAFIREQVSDYMQSYLQVRLRRCKLKAVTKYLESKLTVDQRASYAKFHKFVQKINEAKYQRRENEEKKRVTKLMLEGLLEPLEGFENICDHPIYRVNKMLGVCKDLEQLIPKTQCDLNLRILPLPSALFKRRPQQKRKIKSAGMVEFEHKPPQTSTPRSSLSGIESITSGFLEKTPSKNLTYDDSTVLDDSSSPIAEHDELSVSISTTDTDILSQEEKTILHKITDDLNFETYFAWESRLVKQINEQISASDIYDTSKEVVEVYQRQLMAAKEFADDLHMLLVRKLSIVSD